MAVLISLTPQPRSVSGTGPASDDDRLEVTGLKTLRMSLRVLGAKLTGGAFSATVLLEGSMVEKDYGWIELAQFPAVSQSPESLTVVVEYPMRYLRWNVSALSGCSDLYFEIDGVAWV